VQTNLNVGAVRVEGVDLQSNYKLPLGDRFGSLLFNLSGSYLLEYSTQSIPGAGFYDCSGLYGQTCLTVNPKWRHNLRTSWQTPWDVEITALWRYIGKVSLDTNSADPILTNGANDHFDAHIAAQNYLDLSAAWNVVKSLQVRAGVNNLFDRDPPINASNVVSSGAANSYPTYDQLGRQVFVAFTAKF
jgi:outer membrane receptor protein involved in Fe transport